MWCVPVQGKNPATAGGLKNAVNDPEEFARNYVTCRGATGYGIHLGRSHLAVFDLDVTAEHPLEELEEALDAWFNANTQDGLPKTLVVRTGRETGTGRHYYFRLPVGVDLRSTSSFLGLPIEVRAGEQIVVGPGSLHQSGNRYEPVEWQPIAELDMATLHALQQTIDHTRRRPGFGTATFSTGLVERMMREGLRIGQRDEGFFRFACALRGSGVDEPTARTMITTVWEKSDNPPDDRKEIEVVLEKVRRVYETYPAPETPDPSLVDLAKRWQRDPESRLRELTDAKSGSSWEPIDIGPALRGEIVGALPELLLRTDEVPMLYARTLNLLIGEPESGKTWAALMAVAEVLKNGGAVQYLDFENGPAALVERLRSLGVADDVIEAQFICVTPNEPFDPNAQLAVLETARAFAVKLVIIDAVAEAMNLADLNPYENPDTAEWYAILPNKLVAAGVTVIALDHVTKSRDGRGRWAIGAQHKLAGLDGTALNFEIVTPFSRGKAGYSTVSLAKDRHGHVRRYATEKNIVAKLRIDATEEGQLKTSLETPQFVDLALESQRYENGLAPMYKLAEKISIFVESAATPPNKSQAKTAISGNKVAKDQALEFLIEQGFIEERPGKRTAKLLVSVRQFRVDEGAGNV
jgi:hypothetical protein